MHYALRIGDALQEVELLKGQGAEYTLTLEERIYHVIFEQVGQQPLYSMIVDGESYEFYGESGPASFEVFIQGEVFTLGVVQKSALTDGLGKAGQDLEGAPLSLAAPMPGVIKDIYVQLQQTVERGERLLILEAMKMKNDIKAPRSGAIQAILVTAEQRVNRGDPLVIIA